MKKSINQKKKNKNRKKAFSYEEEQLPESLPILPIKSRPIFPGIITPVMISAGRLTQTVEEAYNKEGFVGLSLIREEDEEKDITENIYTVGIAAKILKKLNMPDGSVNILVNTIHRFRIEKIVSRDPIIKAKVDYPVDFSDEKNKPKNYLKGLIRTILMYAKDLSSNNPMFTEDMKMTLVNINEPGKIADFVGSVLNLEKNEYQEIIEALEIHDRLEKVLLFTRKELELLDVQRKINDQVNQKMDRNQRQYFLREQLKAIQGELGLGEDKSEKKFTALEERLVKANVSEEVLAEVKRELEKLNFIEPHSAEYQVLRNYLDMIEALPWEEPPARSINLKKSRQILEQEHYKLDEVKKRILEFLAVRKLKNDSRSPVIICLVGPPGVGKTSIAKSIAKSLDRKFHRISLGGMRDEAEIKGHRRTYIGALPGKILSALRITKEKDSVVLLDEIDKLKSGYTGDPAGALLEVLDPEQNHSFRDHYLDLPFDLSRVFFIATANTSDTIPRVLLDRMEVISLSGYTTDEKIEIFKRHLWKKILDRNGMNSSKIKISDTNIRHIIDSYSREAGLRSLEKTADKLIRKIALKYLEKGKLKTSIEKKDIEDYLGMAVFRDDEMVKPSVPGTALGLAWTTMGGATLFVESILLEGRAGFQITGKLGKVMNESAAIALSYSRSIFSDPAKFEKHRIHLHVPDGATPKDGPSAGITMASAILSLVSGETLKQGIAMTGELTLTGKVLAIGGLKEKILAAKRANIRKIIFPKQNEAHLKEIPEYIKKDVEFYPVTDYYEVAELIFRPETMKLFRFEKRKKGK